MIMIDTPAVKKVKNSDVDISSRLFLLLQCSMHYGLMEFQWSTEQEGIGLRQLYSWI